MNLHKRLAALFVVSALVSAGSRAGQAPHASPSPYNNENIHDRGAGSGM